MRARYLWRSGAALALLGTTPLIANAQVFDCRERLPPYVLDGRVVARSAPLPPFVEIRLESNGGVAEEFAYTDGTGEFTFTDLNIEIGGGREWQLVVEVDGFLRRAEPLDWRQIACNYGGLMLFIEPQPPDAAVDGPRPRAVDIQQLLAEIPPEAVEAYEEAIADLDAGDGPAATAHFEQAVELAPDYYEALNGLGVEYLKAGRYRDAEARFTRARELNPNDPRPRVHLGTLRFQEGRDLETSGDVDSAARSYQGAIEYLDEARRLDPLVGETWFYLGLALYEMDEFDEAETSLLEAIRLNPRVHDARLTLLNVYTRQGRYEEALGEIAAFLRAQPDSPHRGAVEAIRIQIQGALGR
jgi:tetratricopeptide (TPR) repeat protein